MIGRGALYFVLSAMILLSLATASFAETLLSQKATLPPLILTYGDLQKILDRAAGLISKANDGRSGIAAKTSTESLFLSDGRTGTRISGHSLILPTANLPEAASDFSYTYNSPQAVLTDVEMVFSGSSRSLYVAGYSKEKVKAVFTILENSLLDAGKAGAGMDEATRKFLAKLLLFTLILSTLYCVMKKNPKALGMPLFSLAGLVLLFTLQFDLTPAFTVFSGRPPFTVRYGPQISLTILSLVIAGIPLSWLLPKLVGNKL